MLNTTFYIKQEFKAYSCRNARFKNGRSIKIRHFSGSITKKNIELHIKCFIRSDNDICLFN